MGGPLLQLRTLPKDGAGGEESFGSGLGEGECVGITESRLVRVFVVSDDLVA
jgi:hypothetical protein